MVPVDFVLDIVVQGCKSSLDLYHFLKAVHMKNPIRKISCYAL